MADIRALTMPTWGMSMTEGILVNWLVDVGDEITAGKALAEIETTKITGVYEAHQSGGVLRRRVGQIGETLPVGALIGVVAEVAVSEADIDAFVASFTVAADPAAAEDGGAREQTISVDGISVNVVQAGGIAGERLPLVLVHGVGGNAGNWALTLDALSRRRRVIAIDLPGHGKSTKAVVAPSPEFFATVIRQVSRSLGLTRFHLAGHSYGGLISWMLAVQSPELIASLTLIDPAGVGAVQADDYVDQFIAAKDRGALRSVMGRLFEDTSLASRSMVAEVQEYRRIEGVQETLEKLGADLATRSGRFPPLPNDVAQRTLVIWGGKDKIFPLSQCDKFPAAVRKHTFADVGHMPHIESADFNNYLAQFLESRDETT